MKVKDRNFSQVTFFHWNSFCFFYDLITRNHWIVNNTSYIFTIFAATCSRIANIIVFAHMMLFQIFTLTSRFIPLVIWIKFSTTKFKFTFTWYMLCWCFLLIHVIILKTLRFKSSILFGMHTLLDRSLRVL